MIVEQREQAGRELSGDWAGERLLEYMREEDRELLTLWASGQASTRVLARVLGCHSGTVSRRLRQLQARLQDPVARTLVMYQAGLPVRHREVGLRMLCRGETARQVARSMSMSRDSVRRMLAEVRGWARFRNQ